MEFRAIYSDYVRELVDGVRLDDMLPLYSVILIIFEPRRWIIVVFIVIVF